MNIPDTVGVPLIVITLAAQEALTPAGNPFAPRTPWLEIPVAPVVVWVMFGISAELMHSVGEDDATVTVQVWAVIVFKQYKKQKIIDMSAFFFNVLNFCKYMNIFYANMSNKVTRMRGFIFSGPLAL